MRREVNLLWFIILVSLNAFSQGVLVEREGWLSRVWSETTRVGRQIAASVRDIRPFDLQMGSLSVPLGEIGLNYHEQMIERSKRVKELREQVIYDRQVLQHSLTKNSEQELLRLINQGRAYQATEKTSSNLVAEPTEPELIMQLNEPLNGHLQNIPGMQVAPSGRPQPKPEPLPANLRQDLPDPSIPRGISKRVSQSLQPVPNAEHPAVFQPHESPAFVQELVPHLMRVLQNPQVDRDLKLRNVLNRHLEKLMRLPGDEDLDEQDETLFGHLNQLLDAQGKIIKGVRDAIAGKSVGLGEAQLKAAVEAQQALMQQEFQGRIELSEQEGVARRAFDASWRQGVQEADRHMAERLTREPAQAEAVKRAEAERRAAEQARLAAANQPRENVARTQPMLVDPLKRAGDWYQGPRESQQVGALEWELGHKGSKGMTFKDAQAYAESRKKDGWRLPTIWELEALYQQKSVLGDDLDTGWFWSNVAVAGRDGKRWDLYFEDGDVFYGVNDSRVRLCRVRRL